MDDLSRALAEYLPAAKHDVDVFLTLEALARTTPEVASTAIFEFIKTASDRHARLASNALVLLAERGPALLVAATSDEHAPVADAAKKALLSRPSHEALPFFLRLGKSKNVDEVCTALMMLGRIPSPEVRAPLFKALTHRSVNARQYAAEAIGQHADENWIAELLEAIRDQKREEQEKKKDLSEVTRTLCKIIIAKASSANLELLLSGLQDSNGTLREACIEALGRVGDNSAVQPLLELLELPQRGVRYRSGDPTAHDLQYAIVRSLGQLGDLRAVAPLLQINTVFSAQALGQLQAYEAVPELVAALELAKVPRDASDLAEVLTQLAGPGDQQWPRMGLRAESLRVRRAAALEFYRTAPDDAAIHLLEILAQLAPSDSIAVAAALAELGRAEGFQGLGRALDDDPHHWNANAVVYACERLMGPQVRVLLLSLLPSIRNEYVQTLCSALAAQGAEVLPALISAAQAAKTDVRYRYEMAISTFRAPEVAELLTPLVMRHNPLRDAAWLALSQTPRAQTTAALSAALKQAETAADARFITKVLAQVATAEAIPDLLLGLEHDANAEEIFDALGRLANAEAVPALIEQLTSGNSQRRKGAATALAQIADHTASLPLFELLLTEKNLEVVEAAMAALLRVCRADDVWLHENLKTPGTRAFLVVLAAQSIHHT